MQNEKQNSDIYCSQIDMMYTLTRYIFFELILVIGIFYLQNRFHYIIFMFHLSERNQMTIIENPNLHFFINKKPTSSHKI